MTASMLELPQLTGTRERARQLIASAHLPSNLSGLTVVVDAGATLAGTESFADELVRTILVDRNGSKLVVYFVGPEFGEKLKAAAWLHRVASKLDIQGGPAPRLDE